MKKFIIKILLLALIVVPLIASPQKSGRKARMKEREIQKVKEQRERESFIAYKKAVKRQFKMQSPKTRKEMRKKLRKAKKFNYHRKDFFLKRWLDRRTARKKRHQDTTTPEN